MCFRFGSESDFRLGYLLKSPKSNYVGMYGYMLAQKLKPHRIGMGLSDLQKCLKRSRLAKFQKLLIGMRLRVHNVAVS